MRASEDDSSLIEACIKKDITAWASLVKKYSSLVHISVKNRLKKYNISVSSHEIEDISQDIFADIWKNDKLSGVTNRDDISYWIAILSGNAAIEHFRASSARLAQKTVSLSGPIGEKELGELIPSGATSPQDELARAETEARADEAIESLPEREQLIVKLYLVHDKKYHEIAAFLGIPKGTVSSCIKRAKGKLRKKLQQF